MPDNSWLYDFDDEPVVTDLQDPRTPEEIILDELDQEYRETINSVRPY